MMTRATNKTFSMRSNALFRAAIRCRPSDSSFAEGRPVSIKPFLLPEERSAGGLVVPSRWHLRFAHFVSLFHANSAILLCG